MTWHGRIKCFCQCIHALVITSCNAFICVFKLDLLVNFVVHSSQERVQHGSQFSVAQSFFTLVQWQRKRLLAISVQRNIHILCNQFYWASRGICEYVCVLVIQCFIVICNHNNCIDKDSFMKV